MMTLSRIVLKTNYMIEQMRLNAIDCTIDQFKEAARHYYQTSEGGQEVTKLIHELEELGVEMDEIIDIDLEIRDEVEHEAENN